MPNTTTDSTKWLVGITFTTELNKDFENFKPITWCKPSMDKCVMSVPKNSGWFVFNIQSTGNYLFFLF